MGLWQTVYLIILWIFYDDKVCIDILHHISPQSDVGLYKLYVEFSLRHLELNFSTLIVKIIWPYPDIMIHFH